MSECRAGARDGAGVAGLLATGGLSAQRAWKAVCPLELTGCVRMAAWSWRMGPRCCSSPAPVLSSLRSVLDEVRALWEAKLVATGVIGEPSNEGQQ